MTVSEQIIQVLDALCEKFGMAIDWTGENVIPYVTMLCTKLVSYEIWTSVAEIILMLVLGVIFAIVAKTFYPTFKRGWEANAKSYTDIGWQVAGVFAIVGLVVFYGMALAVVYIQITDIIKCAAFPEMYVFEYIQGVINGG